MSAAVNPDHSADPPGQSDHPNDAEMDNGVPKVGLRGYRVVDAARSAERRATVIRAAARVFSTKGYHAATMDDISQQMGVSKGVLYYQFRSKEDVFTEIMVTATSEALRLLNQAIGGGGSAVDRLRNGIRGQIAFNLDDTTPGYDSILVSGNLGFISASSREAIRTLQRDFQHAVVDLIREGQADGVFDVRDASVAAMNILTAANGVPHWFVAGRSLSADEVADEVSEQLVRGILAKEHADCPAEEGPR
jgi:AcrR family transcriptional regulator